MFEQRRKKKIRKLIQRFYTLLMTFFFLPELLSSFITATTPIRAVELMILFAVLYTFFKLYRADALVKYTNKFVKCSLWALAVITIYILIRGDWQPIYDHVFWLKVIDKGTLSYILPFLILLLPNKDYQKEILRTLYKYSLMVIPLWALSFNQLVQDEYFGENVGVYLPFISIMLLGFPEYFKKKEKIICLLIGLIYLVLMLLNARRNIVLSITLYFCIIYYVQKIKYNKNYILNIILMISFSSVILLFGTTLMDDVFNRFSDRLDEDTRGGVEELFFLDYTEAPVEDWLFGRGIDGGYAQTVIDEETGEESDVRKGIETGYLNMLMHGGILYIVFVYGLMFLALYRASKQNEQKDTFIFLVFFVFLIDSYTTNIINPMTTRLLFFWIFISWELSSQKRLENDFKGLSCD